MQAGTRCIAKAPCRLPRTLYPIDTEIRDIVVDFLEHRSTKAVSPSTPSLQEPVAAHDRRGLETGTHQEDDDCLNGETRSGITTQSSRCGRATAPCGAAIS